MKAKVAILTMSFLGSLTQAAKLLKVPRIYNALIASDEKLIPSQAYPAISPVIQSVQYPIPGYYQTLQPLPVYTYIQQDHLPINQDVNVYQQGYKPSDFNVVDYNLGTDQKKPTIPKLFIPAGTYPINSEPVRPVGNEDKKVYSLSSPVASGGPEPNQQFNTKPRNDVQRPPVPQGNPPSNSYPDYSRSQDLPYPGRNYVNNQEAQRYAENVSALETDDELSQQQPKPDYVKNNRPKDSSIVDVPPPPLPSPKPNSEQKKPEEYPPPPLGYVL